MRLVTLPELLKNIQEFDSQLEAIFIDGRFLNHAELKDTLVFEVGTIQEPIIQVFMPTTGSQLESILAAFNNHQHLQFLELANIDMTEEAIDTLGGLITSSPIKELAVYNCIPISSITEILDDALEKNSQLATLTFMINRELSNQDVYAISQLIKTNQTLQTFKLVIQPIDTKTRVTMGLYADENLQRFKNAVENSTIARVEMFPDEDFPQKIQNAASEKICLFTKKLQSYFANHATDSHYQLFVPQSKEMQEFWSKFSVSASTNLPQYWGMFVWEGIEKGEQLLSIFPKINSREFSDLLGMWRHVVAVILRQEPVTSFGVPRLGKIHNMHTDFNQLPSSRFAKYYHILKARLEKLAEVGKCETHCVVRDANSERYAVIFRSGEIQYSRIVFAPADKNNSENITIYHAEFSEIEKIFKKANLILEKIKNWNRSKTPNNSEFFYLLGKYVWNLSVVCAYSRGSAAITENEFRSLLKDKGFVLLPYQYEIPVDVLALFALEEDFAREFAGLHRNIYQYVKPDMCEYWNKVIYENVVMLINKLKEITINQTNGVFSFFKSSYLINKINKFNSQISSDLNGCLKRLNKQGQPYEFITDILLVLKTTITQGEKLGLKGSAFFDALNYAKKNLLEIDFEKVLPKFTSEEKSFLTSMGLG